jgi:hypothetical protein
MDAILFPTGSTRQGRARLSILVALSSLLGIATMPKPILALDVLNKSGPWSKASNWSLGRLPTRTDDCEIVAGLNVTGDSALECRNFTMGSGTSLLITPGYLFIYGAQFVNQGTINVGLGNGLQFVTPSSTATISGGGTINLTLTDAHSFGGFENTVINLDNHIAGTGQMLMGLFTNHALTDANVAGKTLLLYATSPGVINTGTLQASNGGTLSLSPQGADPMNNTGGVIQALNGSTVLLEGYMITGGTLSSSGTGTLQIINTAGLSNLTSKANISIPSFNVAILQGTIVNNRTFSVPKGSIEVNGTVILKGTGSVTGGSGAFIGSFCCSPANLVVQQLIQGGGAIGDSGFTLTNQSTVNANNAASSMVLTGSPEFNTGTFEASNGATLDIRNRVKNTGGTIKAQTGSTVLLNFGGIVEGGTLATVGTGHILGESGTLDGTVHMPTNTGLLSVPGGFDLNTEGTINNTGTISIGTNACIALIGSTTLTGSGKVAMSPNSCFLAGPGLTLTNQTTIQGAGSIGDSNPMHIVNKGTILANQSTPLLIVPDNTGFTNAGVLAVNHGSVLNIRGTFNNLSGTTLSAGTYNLTGTLGLAGSNIVTNAARVTLTGSSAQILNDFQNTNALTGLTTNLATGSLSLQGGQILNTSTSLSNAGIVAVGTGSGLGVKGTYTQTAGTTTVDGALSATAITLDGGSLLGRGRWAGSHI